MSDATTFINGRPIHGCRKIADTLRQPMPRENQEPPEKREARVNLMAERVACGLKGSEVSDVGRAPERRRSLASASQPSSGLSSRARRVALSMREGVVAVDGRDGMLRASFRPCCGTSAQAVCPAHTAAATCGRDRTSPSARYRCLLAGARWMRHEVHGFSSVRASRFLAAFSSSVRAGRFLAGAPLEAASRRWGMRFESHTRAACSTVRARAKEFGGIMQTSALWSTKLFASKSLGSTTAELMFVKILKSSAQRTS